MPFTELNIVPVIYLMFRLCPIFIVFYFVMQSFIMWNMKGLVFLLGLFFAFIIVIIFSTIFKYMSPQNTDDPTPPNPRCVLINMGLNGKYFSSFPISILIYSFTFFYLIFSLFYNNGGFIKNKDRDTMVKLYTSIFVLFPILIFAEFLWIFLNNCYVEDVKNTLYTPLRILMSFIVGLLVGLIWAIVIDSTKISELKILSSKDDNAVCSRPRKSYFRCKVVT